MKVLWIIDNKYRELWGLEDIREKLKSKKIKLILCNKFNWKSAIEYFEPNAIILPNVRNNSPLKSTVNFAHKKNIKSILYKSEGLHYEKTFMQKEHPIDMLEKLTKIFLWANEEGNLARSHGYEDKLETIGGLRFVFKKKIQEKQKKIITIGIPTTNRYSTSKFYINIPRIIYTRLLKDGISQIGLVRNEILFFICISKIFKRFKNKNFKFILKPHPFEDPKIYKAAFSAVDENITIEEDPDIRNFLNKIDVMINQYSSSNIHAIKAGIPVLNITKLIPWNEDFGEVANDYLPKDLGVKVDDLDDLENYLTKYSSNELFDLMIKKGDLEVVERICPSLNSVDLFTKNIEIILNKKKIDKKKKNVISKIYFFFRYYLKEIYMIFFLKRETLFHYFKLEDRKLLKKFSVLKNN
tara:strand:- start:3037 stop:4269 length:1233 start_codon:yes stop_codon:yes gene_type:complete